MGDDFTTVQMYTIKREKTTNMIGYSCLTFQPELSFKQKRENS